ncbi:GTP 3',8-cyclase MoaA [Brevibacterium sp. BRM-1]|uniref:GTP 3',8-cyclase MoaA n=1 Tax=Brevibacterium sp. BRM-1 TaxID=2999062 RepID=UPI00228089F5|nr:GTP 3',8-cyclase MoaA [Brevibacterium sp. BRM-1]WAL39718.1 GTP 3',8-cyclase MoaA [Brevibacterium sp. BRM-1]
MSIALGMPSLRAPETPGERALELERGLAERAGDAPRSAALGDRFGRAATDLRISLTDKCNLRCTYCMPAEGMDWMSQSSLLTAAEVARLVRIGVERFGIADLRLTGGEPLIRPDLEDIIARVRTAHPRLPIALTTNAIGLAKRAHGLAQAGLTRINISLDTIDADTYAALARRDRLGQVLQGIDGALAAGLAPIKINAVLMRGVNDEQAPELLQFCLDRGLQLRFIEQMPLDGEHGWTRENMVTAADVRARLAERFDLLPDSHARGGAPAELFRVTARGGGPVLGRVGVIASVTEPFCAACTRTRITAEGKVRSCLFSHEEFDLGALLRSERDDAQVARAWQQAMWLKPRAHGMDHTGLGAADYVQPERSMSAIGG